MDTFPNLESFWRDARYGARTLGKSPGFTAATFLTLALGIGANTAIFTLVNALLLQLLPVRNPTQLVGLLHRFPDEPAFNGFSGEAFEIQLRPDFHVLLFTAAIALLTVLLSGLSPAMRAFGAAPASALRQAASVGETKFRCLFGKSLLATQVALSVVLLSAAALFIGYLSNLEHLNLGFRRDHLLLVTLDPSKSGYNNAQFSELSQELLERLRAIPDVRSATLSAMTPVSGSRSCYCVTVEGHEEPMGNRRDMVFINSVAPNYFETYAMPLLAGLFSDQA
jgi:putative ABC transport system permease protein